jgi:hypothetical protein
MGDEGRAFCATLFGLQTDSVHREHFPKATRDWAVKIGLTELGTEAQVLPG